MSRVRLADIGSGAAAAGLDTARAGSFRREVRLSIFTGGVAQAAHVAAGTQLQVTLISRDLDARAAGAPEAALLAMQSGSLALTLPVARQIRSVRLASPAAGDVVAAFRFDGSSVSEDPVAVGTHGASGAVLDVTDRALILKRRNGGSDFALTPSAVSQVVLRYPPANPRLALRRVGDPAEFPFPARIDSYGLPSFPASTPRGADFAKIIQSVLDRLPVPLPDSLEFDLILIADQPCSARIDALDLSLLLETPGLADKTVLRFPGGRRVVERLTLALPAGAQIHAGRVNVSVSGTPPSVVPAETAAPVPPAGGEALALGPGMLAATRLDLPVAELVTGADVVLAAPAGPVRVRANLRADTAGLPGAILAEGGQVTFPSARPASVAFDMPPTAIPAGPVWLVVEALGGPAQALLGGPGASATGDGRNFALHPAARERGLAAALRFAHTSASAPDGGRFELRLGGVFLPGMPDTGAAEIDFSPAIDALTGATAALEVCAPRRAMVTLDTAVLVYTLPG